MPTVEYLLLLCVYVYVCGGGKERNVMILVKTMKIFHINVVVDQ